MNFSRQTPVQNLSSWLDTATRDLVPLAKARVRPEIEAHFAEAVRARLADGLSSAEAQTAALADLGSPTAAARRFRRHYLTNKDVGRLIAMFKSDAKNSSILSYLFLASIFHPSNPAGHLHASFFYFMLSMTSLLLVVAGVACLFTRKPIATLANQQRNLGIHCLSLLSGGVLTLLEGLATLPSKPNYILALLVVVTIFAYAGYSVFHLRQKLLAAGEEFLPRSGGQNYVV